MTAGTAQKEHLAAIRRKGTELRNERNAVLADVKAARVTIAAALTEHEALLRKLPVGKIISAVPGWGPSRKHDLLSRVKVPPETLWQAMTPKQRKRILDEITR